jgi:peptidoglycan hydrolase-like protein with peptidoglycan-binding domain
MGGSRVPPRNSPPNKTIVYTKFPILGGTGRVIVRSESPFLFADARTKTQQTNTLELEGPFELGEAAPIRARSAPEYVRWVQSALNRALGTKLIVDGRGSPATRAAVAQFQRSHKLNPDGVVGPVTEAALASASGSPAPATAAGTVSAVASRARYASWSDADDRRKGRNPRDQDAEPLPRSEAKVLPYPAPEVYETPALAPEAFEEETAEPEYEYQVAPGNLPSDAFVADEDGKAYFTTFPELGDLTVQEATVLKPANFENLVDLMLSSKQNNFVIDAHGDPSGLSMHLASGTKIATTKQSFFILRGIERIRSLMRLAKESNTIWERASGTDLNKWRRILETLHSKTWQKMAGPSWPTDTPQVSDVDAARGIVQSRITALVDALFPGLVPNKQERVDRLIKKMLQLQAKGIREIQFRACNIGKDSGTLFEFRKFLGADHLCAPDVRSGIGLVVPRIDRGAVDRLAKKRLTQLYDLPGGRFAILIEISGATFSAACAADTQAAVAEWVASHLMANSGYRKGTLPLHFLQTRPLVFARDQRYAAHIQCSSSLWEGAVRAHELEEAEAHKNEEESLAQQEEKFGFDSRKGSGEIETQDESEVEQAWASALDHDAALQEQETETLGPGQPFGEAWTGELAGSENQEEALFEREVGRGASAVDPFPREAYVLGLEMTNQEFNNCTGGVEHDPATSPMCGAVADLTGNPELPAFYAHNPLDMLYVASLAKIYPLYVAFELRRRVQAQAKDMIKLGLSTATAGWEQQVFAALGKAWKPKLKAAFPAFPEDMPRFSEIFVLSPTGDVKFAENDPPLSDADLDFRPPNPTPGRPPVSPEFKTPPGKFRDWMRLMLRWSNNEAASKCIRALTYPYINGVLGAAGFFNKKLKVGLWLSGDYLGNDWLKADGAGQPLSPRWARLQRRKVTNFAGNAFQVARLMTFIARSPEMISIMTGVAGIGSYIRNGLAGATPPRAFTAIASKIGCGDEVPPPACGFSHDCAIVRIDRGAAADRTIRYVVVALGGHPNQARGDLHKMVVRFHDCVVARHP